MKIAKKIITIIMIIGIIINIMQGYSLATSFPSFSEIVQSGQEFIQKGSSDGSETFSDEDISDLTVPLANMLTAIGTIIIVIALIFLGIKYILATPEQAAKLKQQLVGVFVAGVIIFGAVTIWRIMYTIMNDIDQNI